MKRLFSMLRAAKEQKPDEIGADTSNGDRTPAHLSGLANRRESIAAQRMKKWRASRRS